MIDLTGNVALVTGASGGIGAATAKLLHKLGAEVIISGTNLAKLENLRAEIGDRCNIKQCDLANLLAAEELVTNLDKLDILVCNAGITRDKLAISMKNEDFSDVLSVNLQANFVLNRAAIKKMMRNRYGRIINVSSVVAVTGNPGQANYCAAKAGLIGMSKALAKEVAARGITVNNVAPGFIATNMTDKLNDEQKTSILQAVPMKKLGKPADIANMIAFLASEQASYITGETMHVNGGMLMV